MVLLNIEPSSTEKAFEEVSKMSEVKEALQVYGEYDAGFVIDVPTVEHIQKFIKTIRKIKGVTRTVTLIGL